MEVRLANVISRLQDLTNANNQFRKEFGQVHTDLQLKYTGLAELVSTRQQFTSLEARMERFEKSLATIQSILQGRDYGTHFSQLHDTLKNSHVNLAEDIYDSKYIQSCRAQRPKRKRESENNY